MFNSKSLFRLAAMVCMAYALAVGASAQKEKPEPSPEIQTKPIVVTAARFDISPPFRTMASSRKARKIDKEEDDKGELGPVGDLRHDPDAALQTVMGKGVFNSNNDVPTLGVSFNGISNPTGCGGCSPPDPNGEIGPNYYVQMVNLKIQVFSRTGVSLFGPVNTNTLWTGFGGDCETENAGDPVVLYDQMANRWLISQFSNSTAPFFNCVAISQTSDPTGTYYRYAFSAPSFPDYPKYGVWPDAYYLNTRESGSGVLGMYALDRGQMLIGNPLATSIRFTVSETGTGPNGLLPADLDGSMLPPAGSPNYFVGTRDNDFGAAGDALLFYKFHADFTTPANSSLTGPTVVPTAAFDSVFPCSGGTTPSRNCIGQPGTTTKIDILSYRQRPTFRLAYRNFGTYESLVTSQSVEAQTGIAGMRWYEVRSPNTTPTIFQQGTYSPDTVNRWMGSVAMDSLGNMGMAYNVSDATSVFPGIRYTGRLVDDPLGTMPQGEGVIVAGAGVQTSTGSRWGDYSALSVDPSDDCTFWYTNEYYSATSAANWNTRIGSFKFPSCTAVAPATATISGRVTNAAGRGILGATLQLRSLATGVIRTATLNRGGVYSFANCLTGETYTVMVSSPRFTFTQAVRLLNLSDNVTGFDFVSTQ